MGTVVDGRNLSIIAYARAALVEPERGSMRHKTAPLFPSREEIDRQRTDHTRDARRATRPALFAGAILAAARRCADARHRDRLVNPATFLLKSRLRLRAVSRPRPSI